MCRTKEARCCSICAKIRDSPQDAPRNSNTLDRSPADPLPRHGLGRLRPRILIPPLHPFFYTRKLVWYDEGVAPGFHIKPVCGGITELGHVALLPRLLTIDMPEFHFVSQWRTLRTWYVLNHRFNPSGSSFKRSTVTISWKNQGSPEFLRNIAHIAGYFVPSYSFQSLNR